MTPGECSQAGKTAIEIAKECGHEAIVSLFPTTLGAAIEAGYLSEIVRMLDMENADVNSTVGDYVSGFCLLSIQILFKERLLVFDERTVGPLSFVRRGVHE